MTETPAHILTKRAVLEALPPHACIDNPFPFAWHAFWTTPAGLWDIRRNGHTDVIRIVGPKIDLSLASPTADVVLATLWLHEALGEEPAARAEAESEVTAYAKQVSAEAVDEPDPEWAELIAGGETGGDVGANAVCLAYSLGLNRGVERATRQAQAESQRAADQLPASADDEGDETPAKQDPDFDSVMGKPWPSEERPDDELGRASAALLAEKPALAQGGVVYQPADRSPYYH